MRWIGLSLLVFGVGAVALAAPRPQTNPVLPPPPAHLRFDHGRHAEQPCQSCHPGVGLRARPASLGGLGHPRCASCHPEATEARPAAPACRQCHRGTPRDALRRPAVLRFSHAVHAGAPQGCKTCHDPRAPRVTASAERCAACHAELLDGGRCDACHPARASGRLLLDGLSGRLVPTGGHGGPDHRSAWARAHGPAARLSAGSCRACHPQRDCDACHRGVTKPFAQHPADWELSHASLARGDAHRCNACHRSQADCLACHRSVGLALDPDSPVNHRVHPDGFAASGHAAEARRNLLACTGCHTEADCIRCHGGAGLGAGVSPHPPGFVRRCSLLKRRNPRPCAKCHLDLDRRCP